MHLTQPVYCISIVGLKSVQGVLLIALYEMHEMGGAIPRLYCGVVVFANGFLLGFASISLLAQMKKQ